MLSYAIGYGTGNEMIIEFIVNFLRIILIRQAVELFLTKRDMDARVYKAAYGIFYLMTSAAYCIWGVSLWYEVCNFIGIAGITCCYDDTWKKRMWTAISLFCIDLCCLLVAFFSFSGSLVWVGGKSLYLKNSMSVLLFLISVTALSHSCDSDGFKQAIFDKRQTLLLLVTPVTSILVLFSMLYAKLENAKITLVVCICMLVINLSIFYLYHDMIKSYTYLRERDLYKQQTALYQNQMEIIMESQSRIRALRHDMKNHILALQAVAGNGGREEVQEYLQKMQDFMVNPAEYVMTGNESVDSLLNYKIGRAKELLHVVETKISIPEKLNLYSFDLNVILGNLLDNAVEAAVQTEEKELRIQMSVDRGVLFLNITNSYHEKFSGKRGIWKTTKMDKQHHGIGMKNVQKIVEKYHGDMEITCGSGRFEADIMLYMKEL